MTNVIVEAGFTPPGLGPSDVHFWCYALPLQERPLYPAIFGRLAPDEQDRALRYRFEKDRVAFVESRFFLRHVLGRYLRMAPEDVVFAYGKNGKPFLGTGMPDPGIQFNLSHCQGMVLCGVARDREIGVDVEKVRALDDLAGIGRQVFSQNELSQIMALDPEARLEAFYRCWTRKEAWIKATGEGMSADLRSFEVSILPGEHTAGDWTLLPLDLGAGFVASAALPGFGWRAFAWQAGIGVLGESMT